jgi:hypothetical protein
MTYVEAFSFLQYGPKSKKTFFLTSWDVGTSLPDNRRGRAMFNEEMGTTKLDTGKRKVFGLSSKSMNYFARDGTMIFHSNPPRHLHAPFILSALYLCS